MATLQEILARSQNGGAADLIARAYDITPEQAEADQVPMEVSLQPAPRHRLRPGIGYGTNTGGRVSLSYKNMLSGEHPHARQSRAAISRLAKIHHLWHAHLGGALL